MLVSPVQGAEAAYALQKTPADPVKAEASSAPQTFYFSPALVIDPKVGTAVLEYRDTSTGEVTHQYPSEKDIAAYTNSQKQAKTDATALSKPGIDASSQKDASQGAETKPALPEPLVLDA